MKSADTFDDFYHATRNRLLHQMYAMTGNLADAQDCVQEAYARAWQRWEQVSEHASPEAWLRTVAWRIAASRWRKFRNGVAAVARHGPPSHAPEPSPDNVALVAALKQIPEAQRRTIVLHHLADLPVEEVARELGVATGTVKARLSRGRAALADLLREDSGSAEAMPNQPVGSVPAQSAGVNPDGSGPDGAGPDGANADWAPPVGPDTEQTSSSQSQAATRATEASTERASTERSKTDGPANQPPNTQHNQPSDNQQSSKESDIAS